MRTATSARYKCAHSNVRYVGRGSQARAFLESHDVVGDLNNGARLATAIDSANRLVTRAPASLLGAGLTFSAPVCR